VRPRALAAENKAVLEPGTASRFLYFETTFLLRKGRGAVKESPMLGPRTLGVAWFSLSLALGCDVASENTLPSLGEVERRDPNDVGSNDDVGAEDLGDATPVERYGRLEVVGRELRDESGKTALRWMRNNWNLSLIRAAMGIEPAGAYLQDPEKARGQVERVVDNAIEAGVYVIVDWHAHEAERHTDEAVAFFSEISAKYAGVPNVIYETFNEPRTTDWKGKLKPYHEAVVAAIRENDREAIIILGTGRYSQLVLDAAASPVKGENLMYTLHFYACEHNFRSEADQALLKNLPIFVTEWGATAADGGLDGLVCAPQAQLWIDWMRARGISWAAWKLDNCVPDSTCFLTPDAPLEGSWTDQYLRGHGPFLRGRLQED
jgi:endoglucanase